MTSSSVETMESSLTSSTRWQDDVSYIVSSASLKAYISDYLYNDFHHLMPFRLMSDDQR